MLDDLITNKNLRNFSKKFSRLFAITVSFTTVEKCYVFGLLEEFCCRILVSQETHFNSEPHHHIYMRTNVKYKIKEIRAIVNSVYDKPQTEEEEDDENDYVINGVLVQTVRNEQNYLKYITKYDINPVFSGINENDLSFYYNSIKWATSTENFEYSHSHVLNYPQYYKLLERVHENVQKSKKKSLVQILRPFFCVLNLESKDSWQDEVIGWWNDWIINGYRHKKPQLFLWGGSNTGKTTFIFNLVKSCVNIEENENEENVQFEEQIFRPTPNEKKYAWQDFDTNLHNIVIVDEFDISEYNITDLKKVLSGECLVANRKGGSSKKIRLAMPMIFISNLPPPTNDLSTQIQGFRERLKIVRADKLIKNL